MFEVFFKKFDVDKIFIHITGTCKKVDIIVNYDDDNNDNNNL
jgi:hypothetical protein